MYRIPLEQDELILKKDMATLNNGDSTSVGALYLTTERLVFIGYTRTAITTTVEEEIPLVHVEKITAAKALGLIDNVIVLETIRQVRWVINISQRNAWIREIEAQLEKI